MIKSTFSTLTLIGLSALAPSADAFVRGKELSNLPAGFVHYRAPMGYCSGTKISEQVILTAAHCVASLEEGDSLKLLSHAEHFVDYENSAPYQALELEVEKITEEMNVLWTSFVEGEITEEEHDQQSEALDAKMLQVHEKMLEMAWYGPYRGNPVKAIYAHPKHKEKAGGNPQFDIALIVLEKKIPKVTTANVDTTYKPHKRTDYMMLGHNKRTEIDSGVYHYDLINKIKVNDSYGVYSFHNRLHKGKTSFGDSGGPLYRKNPRTGKYDTVIGTVMGAIRLFGFADKEMFYVPLNNPAGGNTAHWLKESLTKAKALTSQEQ